MTAGTTQQLNLFWTDGLCYYYWVIVSGRGNIFANDMLKKTNDYLDICIAVNKYNFDVFCFVFFFHLLLLWGYNLFNNFCHLSDASSIVHWFCSELAAADDHGACNHISAFIDVELTQFDGFEWTW